MHKKIRVGNKNTITLTDRNYLASGGQGEVYVNGGDVYKIYHDSKKCISTNKIQELNLIQNPNVIIPKDIICDFSTGEIIGYTTNFINNTDPLLKYFTKTFKVDNNINNIQICDLIKKMQLITNDIHKNRCLIVDYNELNILIRNENNSLNPFYIDCDSYVTPSSPHAAAIMDSIRDRNATKYVNGIMNYNPTELTDWFSWSILAFYLYVNVHPYRASHPNYKPNQKTKQFDDGISVFHQGSKLPPMANPLTVIPNRHLDYFKRVFLNGERDVPPLADSIVPLTVPTTIVVIKGTNKIDVNQINSYSENVVTVSQYMGVNYVVTSKHIYSNTTRLMDTNGRKCLVTQSNDGTMIVAIKQGNQILFKELATGKDIDVINSPDMFVRNNCVYVTSNGKLIEYTFTTLGNRIVPRILEVENVSNISTKIYDGCLIQNLLGKYYIAIPSQKNICINKYIPQLDGYRIIECKSESTVTVIIAEKNGQYDRFILVFKKDYSDFDVRKVEDIAYDSINFTVMSNGLCALLSSPTELELFVNNQKDEVLENPPLDATMKLFNTPDGIFFIANNSIHQIRRK